MNEVDGGPLCHGCDQPSEGKLERCSVCFRYFCEDHCHRTLGRDFCSKRCAEYHQFGDPDAEEEYED